MLSFTKISAEDFQFAAPIMYKLPYMSSECSFVALYLWREASGCEICIDGETVFYRIKNNSGTSYLFPYGGELKGAMEKLYAEEKAKGNSCVHFLCVTKKMRQALEEVFPGEFSYSERRASFDYIYSAESLASLSGKRFHQKKNHVNKFMKKYDGRYVYEPLGEENIREVLVFQEKWIRMAASKQRSEMLMIETCAIKEILLHFSEFHLVGGVLRVDGQICAYCIGSRMSEDAIDVLVEKADYAFDGAYQMINRCFANQVADSVMYLNREDDMGLEGLRKSKLSYCPEMLIEKYSVVWKR